MVERSGTSDSPNRLMVRAAAKALFDAGHTREDTLNDLDPRLVMAATAAVVRVAPDSIRWELINENRDPRLFDALADSLEGDDAPLARILCDGACHQAEYILTQALETLPSRAEIARDQHVDQQIDQMKMA